MTFTDDDLKRLKELSKRKALSGLEGDIDALLARLEAAEEAVINYQRVLEYGLWDNPNLSNSHLIYGLKKSVQDRLGTWRKASGKAGDSVGDGAGQGGINEIPEGNRDCS